MAPVALSAEHGEGLGDLFEHLRPHLEREQGEEEEEKGDGPLKLAIVGRPNAGKSTLMNAILGEDRVLTSPEAGTTRDSIAVDFEHGGRALRLVDTA